MTSPSDPIPVPEGDDPAAVLACARARKLVAHQAERDVMQAAVVGAAMHSTDSLVGRVDEWHEAALPMGGEGCPEVAEFAIIEFAAALGRSTESGRRYLAHAMEGRYWRRPGYTGQMRATRPAWAAEMRATTRAPGPSLARHQSWVNGTSSRDPRSAAFLPVGLGGICADPRYGAPDHDR